MDKIILNEFGLCVWKHKTNKRLFLQQSYSWKDDLVLLDETEGRQIVDSFVASSFDYSAWTPMTEEEFGRVKSKYMEIYDEQPVPFKDKMKNDFIPFVKRMIDKEEKHLEILKTHDQSNEQIRMFTLRSESVLNHLNERLTQYEEYIK